MFEIHERITVKVDGVDKTYLPGRITMAEAVAVGLAKPEPEAVEPPKKRAK